VERIAPAIKNGFRALAVLQNSAGKLDEGFFTSFLECAFPRQ
jgi:hypothetical protein